MSASTPAANDAKLREAVREIYVYRDMTEGYMTSPQLSIENLNVAIAALQQARALMLQHGIRTIPRRS